MFLCGMAQVGLTLHNRSLRLTQRMHADEVRRQSLLEQRDSLLVEVARLSGFARLESLWIADGRPQVEEVGTQESEVMAQELESGRHEMVAALLNGQGGQ